MTRPPLDDEDAAFDEMTAAMADEFGLDERDVQGLSFVAAALDLHQRLGGFDPTEPMGELAQLISIPPITQVLTTLAWVQTPLEPFLTDIVRGVLGPMRAGPLTVLAACAEARADVLGAERHLRAAVSADHGFIQAVLELAFLDEERGDYAAALKAYRVIGLDTAGEPRHGLEALVTDYGHGRYGRNDPCPCGSGRKFKACHLDRLEVTPPDPADALFRKLGHWQVRADFGRILDELHAELNGDPEVADDVEPVDELLSADVAMWDLGGLQRYLDTRGVLLPDSERVLLGHWLSSRRALYEVISVQPGRGLVLREVNGSLEVKLRDRSLSRLEPLDLICLRLMPDGVGSVTTVGGFRVPRPQRESVGSLIELGDGVALLQWLADPMPAMRVQTMEGEEILFVTTTYRLPDPAAAAEALEQKLRLGDDGIYREFVERRGREWIRGSITIEGDIATVEANAKRRADRLERTLRKAAPGVKRLKRIERTMAQAAADGPADSEESSFLDPETNPDVAAAMEQVMREYERTWCDEPIPMLGGLTPRQAVGDPAARKELEAMLDDMTWQNRRSGSYGVMDPERIRTLLEI